MTAIDTNVLIRIVTNDDADQVRRATALMKTEDRVFISKTVLLELGWVLRAFYRLDREAIFSSVSKVLSASNVEVEDAPAVTQALEWFGEGMDFADSLHLASAGSETKFATFDIGLQRIARRLGITSVESL